MTYYNFMPASKVIELDQIITSICDYIFGDMAGEEVTQEHLDHLSGQFAIVHNLIESCKEREE